MNLSPKAEAVIKRLNEIVESAAKNTMGSYYNEYKNINPIIDDKFDIQLGYCDKQCPQFVSLNHKRAMRCKLQSGFKDNLYTRLCEPYVVNQLREKNETN